MLGLGDTENANPEKDSFVDDVSHALEQVVPKLEMERHIGETRTATLMSALWKLVVTHNQVQTQVQLFESVTNAIPYTLFAYDPDGRIVYVNKTGEIYSGRPSSDLIGKKISDLGSTPLTLDRFNERMACVLQGETVVTEYILEWMGVPRVWSTTDQPMTNPQGDIEGMVSISRDVTNTDKTQEALIASEQRYQFIAERVFAYASTYLFDIENLPETIWMTNGFEETTGYTMDELRELGGFKALVHPADLHVLYDNFKTMQTTDEAMIEFRILTKSGEQKWIRTISFALSQPELTKRTIYSASMEITNEKKY